MRRMVSPAIPAHATSPVTTTAAGDVVSIAPAPRSSEMNGLHDVVPRSTSGTDAHCVVARADSMNSRKGGLTRPMMSSGTIHHVVASATHTAHQALKVQNRRVPAPTRTCSSHHNAATAHAKPVATAFTAPISATATAERAARFRSGTSAPCSSWTRGSSTHGASITGAVSELMAPSVVSTCGASTNATAATTRLPREPVRSASASRTIPQKPAKSSSAHHRRCVIHGGTCRNWPSAKKAPCGKK
ncbi:hypothetical protein TSOC111612_21570 [Tsukamurella ocularis]